MTIQNFSDALNEQGSNLHPAFDELRQAKVAEAVEQPPMGSDAGGWLPWG